MSLLTLSTFTLINISVIYTFSKLTIIKILFIITWLPSSYSQPPSHPTSTTLLFPTTITSNLDHSPIPNHHHIQPWPLSYSQPPSYPTSTTLLFPTTITSNLDHSPIPNHHHIQPWPISHSQSPSYPTSTTLLFPTTITSNHYHSYSQPPSHPLSSICSQTTFSFTWCPICTHRLTDIVTF